MKKLFFCLLFLLLYAHAFSQQAYIRYLDESENSKEFVQNNRIKRELVYTFNITNNEIKDSSLVVVINYDTTGNIREKHEFVDGKKPEKKYSYFYNGLNKLTKLVLGFWNTKSTGTTTGTTYEYEYDSTGKEINKYEYNKDTTKLIIESKVYNEKNQLIKILTRINNNEYFVSRQHLYKDDGNLWKIQMLDKDGKLICSYVHEYDTANNKKTVFVESSLGRHLDSEYFYNSNMQCIRKCSQFNAKASARKEPGQDNRFDKVEEYLYNEDGTLYEWNVSIAGKKVQVHRHFYFDE